MPIYLEQNLMLSCFMSHEFTVHFLSTTFFLVHFYYEQFEEVNFCSYQAGIPQSL